MIDIPQISCSRCNQPMPLLRKTKFGYDFCVNCSNVTPKKGISVHKGPGEDTWEELLFVEQSQIPQSEERNINSLEEDE